MGGIIGNNKINIMLMMTLQEPKPDEHLPAQDPLSSIHGASGKEPLNKFSPNCIFKHYIISR